MVRWRRWGEWCGENNNGVRRKREREKKTEIEDHGLERSEWLM
jgi:hypothetical protein